MPGFVRVIVTKDLKWEMFLQYPNRVGWCRFTINSKFRYTQVFSASDLQSQAFRVSSSVALFRKTSEPIVPRVLFKHCGLWPAFNV
eukprot:1228299-Pleurochrysis_carterae.AAC.2